jgi:hypothetical protein
LREGTNARFATLDEVHFLVFYDFVARFQSGLYISYEAKSRICINKKTIFKKTSSVDTKTRVTLLPFIAAKGNCDYPPAAIIKG